MNQSAEQPDEIAQTFWRGASADSEALGRNNASGMVGPGRWNLCARAVGQTHNPVRLTALASRMDHFESSFPKRMNRVCDPNLSGRITKSIRSVECIAHIPKRPRRKLSSSSGPTYSFGLEASHCLWLSPRQAPCCFPQVRVAPAER
jgi:hypothetical protein